MTTSTTQVPTAAPPTRARWWVLIAMCLAMLLLQMDNMVLNVALPTLAADLDASNQQLQLMLTAYMVPFAGLLLLAGSLSDRFGRKRLLIIGLLLFAAASAAGAWVDSAELLIAARFVMGLGGALMMPSTMSILIVYFPDEQERRKAMSSFAVMSVLGLVGGPVVGGLLLEHFWWGSIFLLNVPLAALALAAALFLLTESRGPVGEFDPVGALLSVIWTGCLVWAIIELPRGFTTPVRLVLLAGLVALVLFLVWESVIKHPMVPLSLFRNRDFSGSCFAIVLVMFTFGGFLLVLTQYLQSVLGYRPAQAAISLLPLVVAMLLVQPIATSLGARIGQRGVLSLGLVIVAAAFALLLTVGVASSYVALAPAFVGFGVGAGMAQPAAMTLLTGAIPADQAGVGSALNDTMLQTGAALGVACLGSLLARGMRGHDSGAGLARQAFVDAMHQTFTVSVAVVLLGVVIAMLVIRPRRATDVPRSE
ncbi:MFS transporter [Flexivirga meconopsidis]|uniref:MFS transporter n=1 Tax=Flexivirga meconopsidis TaxID=2977121 RepID=UPI00223EA467|nr:MFS transporter [Flexivirga meconopsidis]